MSSFIIFKHCLKIWLAGVPWVAQFVKRPTLNLSSGLVLDLRVTTSGPTLGSMLNLKPTLKEKKRERKTRGKKKPTKPYELSWLLTFLASPLILYLNHVSPLPPPNASLDETLSYSMCRWLKWDQSRPRSRHSGPLFAHLYKGTRNPLVAVELSQTSPVCYFRRKNAWENSEVLSAWWGTVIKILSKVVSGPTEWEAALSSAKHLPYLEWRREVC